MYAIEGEEDRQFSAERRSNAIHASNSSAGGSAGASAAAGGVVSTVEVNTTISPAQRKPAQTGGGVGEKGEEDQDELDVEEDEDFGPVELVVTQDGGIIPVTAAVVEDAAVAAAAAASSAGKRGGQRKTRTGAAGHGPASRAVKGKDAPAGAAGGAAVTAKEKVASTSESEQSVRNTRREAVGGGRGDGRATGVEECKGGGAKGEGEEGEREEEETPLPPDALLTLSDDVLHNTMLFLHPEEIFECRAVSSRWEFPFHEAVFEGLCRRTYLAQVGASSSGGGWFRTGYLDSDANGEEGA